MDCQQQQQVIDGKDPTSCSPQWLADRLAFESDQDGDDQTGSGRQSTPGGRVLLVDCRPSESFMSVRIKAAVNLALPTLMLRRFIRGHMSVDAVASHIQQQRSDGHLAAADNDDVIASDLRSRTLVFYDDSSTSLSFPVSADGASVDAANGNFAATNPAHTGNNVGTTAQQPLVIVLTQRFRQQEYDAVLLDGGLQKFQQQFPHLCSTSEDQLDSVTSSINRMSVKSRDENDDDVITKKSPETRHHLSKIQMPNIHENESDLANQLNGNIPTIILPYLYIGNAQNAQDLNCLLELGIHHVLNVTNNIPNKFEENCEFHYLRIPVNDHWSQNLSSYLPKAVRFIDDARTSKRGVLVHCLAGISRSVTVTVAYLMASHSLSLELAYDHVKRCRPTASPSLNFMGQLMDFEATLDPDRPRSLCCRHLSNYSACTEQVIPRPQS